MEHLHVIIDESGSMASMAHAVYDGARELIEGVKSDGTVCITRFSTTVTLGEDMTPAIARENMQPGRCSGSTALYDAICTALNHDAERHANQTLVTIAIVTDGVENASVQSTLENVRSRIATAESKNWRIVFLGSNQNAVLTAETMGIRAGRALTYGNSVTEARGAFRSLNAANNRFVSGEDESFTPSERQVSHNTQVLGDTGHRVAHPQSRISTPVYKWVSVDPRTGEVVPFDAPLCQELETAWSTQSYDDGARTAI